MIKDEYVDRLEIVGFLLDNTLIENGWPFPEETTVEDLYILMFDAIYFL
jgi:hypothetical protein